jgi:excisionase family DNA binding protein
VSSQPKLLLSLSEAADLLGLKPSNLYELTRARSRARQAHPIPMCRLGKRIAFRRESLEQWIAALEGEARR